MNGSYTLAIYALLFLALWFFMIRPASKRNREMRQDQSSATIGSEVMLTSGIFGRVSSIDEDSARIGIEIAPGVEIHVARSAIANVVPAKTVEADDVEGDAEVDAEAKETVID